MMKEVLMLALAIAVTLVGAYFLVVFVANAALIMQMVYVAGWFWLAVLVIGIGCELWRIARAMRRKLEREEQR